VKAVRARVLLVTGPGYADAHVDAVIRQAASLAPPGAFAVQLRSPDVSPAVFEARARALRALTRELGAPLVINGDARLAAAVDADGVHLGGFARRVAAEPSLLSRVRAEVGPARAIFVPVHSAEDAAWAAAADALLVSPIFATPGKVARGVAAIVEARDVLRRSASEERPEPPCFALGGVDSSNAQSCRDAGASGAAVIRALLAVGPGVGGAREMAALLAVWPRQP
jgi:thiamine-phosphate pyrophosphorylase